MLENIDDLWMMAHARSAMDSQTDVAGNSHDSSSVIETIKFVMFNVGINYETPGREEIIQWMNENNMADEVEYLMEE